MIKPTVLVVDDTSDVRELLGLALEERGYEVLKAEDGRQALDIFSRTSRDKYPVVVVLDIMMPKVDGYGVLDGLNRIEYKGKVVVFSAVGEEDRTRLAGYPLVNAVVRKPSDLDPLLKTIGGLIGESGEAL